MNVNVFLFDDFETMDAFGPAQVFGMAPEHFHVNYLSVNGGIVNSSQGVKVWTEILEPEELQGILLIPGGRGANKLLNLEPEALALIKTAVKNTDFCLMVGNGSAILVQTGLLYRRQIADYSYDANWKRMFSAGQIRISGIRWTADGKYYSSADTFSGLDMSLGVMADIIDIDLAADVAKKLGYQWNYEDEEGILR